MRPLVDKKHFIHLVEFRTVFPGERAPTNRLDLVKTIPKNLLIWIFSELNKRTKSPVEFKYDLSLEKQTELIAYLCDKRIQLIKPYLRGMVSIMYNIQQSKSFTGAPVLISRVMCIHALQEMVRELPDTFQISYELSDEEILNLFKYIACVNEHIGQFRKREGKPLTFHEELISAGIVLNEPLLTIMPLMIFNWYMNLVKYFQSNPKFNSHIETYFNKIGFTPQEFLHHIATIYFEDRGNYSVNRHTRDDVDGTFTRLYEFMSAATMKKPLHDFDIIPIRKHPIYKVEGEELRYTIMDFSLILDKMYEMFINDFWFDYLEPAGIDIRAYRSAIGYFFEGYCTRLFKDMFSWSRQPIQCTSENLIRVGKEQEELGDVYYRNKKNIIRGELKATGIYTKNREGFTDSFYGKGMDEFYDSFGISQLIKNIRRIHEYGPQIDSDFPTGNIVIYPILVLNERYFLASYITTAFQQRMKQIFDKDPLPSNIHVRPIAVFHLSDLENLVYMIKSKKVNIWDLLKKNFIKNPQEPNHIGQTMHSTGVFTEEFNWEFTDWAGVPGRTET